jgi:ribosome modulation factor
MRVNPLNKQRVEAYHRGYKAGGEGQPFERCPYGNEQQWPKSAQGKPPQMCYNPLLPQAMTQEAGPWPMYAIYRTSRMNRKSL